MKERNKEGDRRERERQHEACHLLMDKLETNSSGGIRRIGRLALAEMGSS